MPVRAQPIGPRAATILVALLSALALLAALAPAAGATSFLYWGNNGSNALSRAALDGSGGGPVLPGGATVNGPAGLAIDAAAGKLYWANAEADLVSVANLDGTGGADLPIAGAPVLSPSGIALEPLAGKLYWANDTSIAVANLDGSGGATIPTGSATVDLPSGVAIDSAAGRIYWANVQGGSGGEGAISYANLDGSGGADLPTGAATVFRPSGVAVEGGRVYWANANGLASAATDGSGGADLDTSPVAVAGGTGVAIDPVAGRVYWASSEAGTLGSASLGGGGGAPVPTAGATPNEPAFPALLEQPAGAAPPAISPTATGFSCTSGEWAADLPGAFLARAPQSYAYEWLRDGIVVGGQHSTSLTPEAAGSYSCRVTAANAAGSAEQSSSALTVPLTLQLRAGKRQRVGKLKVAAGCGTLSCKVQIRGFARIPKGRHGKLSRFALQPRTVGVAAGASRSVPVRFKNNRRTLKRVTKLLRAARKKARRRAKAIIKVYATDPGGTAARQTVRVKLVPPRR